jgi:intracellular multiplication protein IcmB
MPVADGVGSGVIDACRAGMVAQRDKALSFSTAESCVFEVKTTVAPRELFLESTHEQFVNLISQRFPGDYASLWRLSKDEFEARKGPAGIQVKGVSKGGSHSVKFAELFKNVSRSVSWRMSLTLKAGYKSAQHSLYKKTRLARFVDYVLGTRFLDKHSEDMIELAENFQELLECRMTFHAWGQYPKKEAENVMMLYSVLHGMGVSDLSSGVVVSAQQAFQYLPISRPGSLWRTGSVLFLTKEDGKTIPYSPYSSNQGAHTEFVYDARGKSLESYHSIMNRSMIAVRPGLPRIGRITIGGRSDPFIDALSVDLAEDEKALVMHKVLTPAIEDAVNIFGTSYGIQTAAEFEVRGITSFLTMLCSDEFGRVHSDSLIYDLLRMGITEVYQRYSENECPKLYVSGVCEPVDEALANLKENAPDSWWGVVSLLHKHQQYELAMRAQHHAVPVLLDFANILEDSSMIDGRFYQVKDWNTGEPIIAVVRRKILAAIEQWPALSQPTMFDIGIARIVTISVSSAGKHSIHEVAWAEAVLYLLARSALISRDFNMRQGFNRHLIPEAFREYHQQVADEKQPNGRKLCFSQYEKLIHFPAVVECLMGDLRNSRMTGSTVTVDMNEIRGVDDRFLDLFTTFATLAPESLDCYEKDEACALNKSLDCEGFSEQRYGINLLFSARTRSDIHYLMEHKLFLPLSGNS